MKKIAAVLLFLLAPAVFGRPAWILGAKEPDLILVQTTEPKITFEVRVPSDSWMKFAANIGGITDLELDCARLDPNAACDPAKGYLLRVGDQIAVATGWQLVRQPDQVQVATHRTDPRMYFVQLIFDKLEVTFFLWSEEPGVAEAFGGDSHVMLFANEPQRLSVSGCDLVIIGVSFREPEKSSAGGEVIMLNARDG